MHNTLTTTSAPNLFSNLRPAHYLRFKIADDQLSNNNLAILQLKKGAILEVKEKMVGNKIRLGLYFKNCLIALVPMFLSAQVYRNMQKGTEYYAEVESLSKFHAIPPFDLQLLLKSLH
jgi:hypothetical protein